MVPLARMIRVSMFTVPHMPHKEAENIPVASRNLSEVSIRSGSYVPHSVAQILPPSLSLAPSKVSGVGSLGSGLKHKVGGRGERCVFQVGH